MHGKKSDTKFTIQFSHKNPSHIQVAEILNQQARGNKAQYIVDAVLHYVNSGGAQEAQPRSGLLDARQVETIVNRMLQDRQIHGGGSSSAPAPVATASTSSFPAGNEHGTDSSAHQVQPANEIDMDNVTEVLGDEDSAVIASALNMFRQQ